MEIVLFAVRFISIKRQLHFLHFATVISKKPNSPSRENVMKFMRGIKSTLSLLMYLSVCVITDHALSQNVTSAELLQKEVSLNVVNKDLLVVMRILARENKVSIGVEFSGRVSDQDNQDEKISINVKQQPLRQVLDGIFQNQPLYTWKLVDGVINVTLRNASNSPLDIGVSQFQVNEVDREELEMAIYAIPELRSALEWRNLSVGFAFAVKPLSATSPKISLNLSHTTVRIILNEIAKSTYFWHTQIFDKRLFIHLR